MSEFITRVRQRLTIIWERIKPYGRYLLSGLLLLIIGLTGYSLLNDDKNTVPGPEVAQVFEPSIGTPLPPDVNPDARGSQGTAATEPAATVEGDSTTEPALTSPHTGIDDDEPVIYTNEQLNFGATLPPGTEVRETAEGIIFSSKAGQIHYVVSTAAAGRESLQTIQAQLQNSPTVKNITSSTINGLAALTFHSEGKLGIAFIKDGTIYYLLGQKYLETFHTI